MAKSYLDKDGLLYFLQKIRPSATPSMDGTASTGTSKRFAAEDHVHPSDTTKAPLASPALTGTPTAPTAATGTANTQIATTEFVSNTVGAMTSGVADVQVDNVSVVTSGIAKINTMTGATSSSAGAIGLVPAPLIGAQNKMLFGDGDWHSLHATVSGATDGSKTITARKDSAQGTVVFSGTFPAVSTTTSGFMLPADKTKLDGITYTGVSDVKIAGTSILSDGSANITNSKLGQSYGTCSTASSTYAKVVDAPAYTAVTGGIVAVYFENAASYLTTLNINSTGAKYVKYKDTTATASSPLNVSIAAGSVAYFMLYAGENYILLNWQHTTASSARNGYMSSTDKSKLDGIASGAEVNVQSDWNQATTTADDFIKNKPTIVNTRGTATSGGTTLSVVNTGDMYTWNNKIDGSAKGAANGVCPLNASSKIDSTYLPSYVDDVIEAYARSGQTALSSTWLSTTSGGSALTPETGKIYVLMADSGDYAANSQFRWSGSAYVKLADGGVSSITNAEIDTIVAA